MGDDGESVKHHNPQYPLPEEIRKMARDETVCKYCGVSYLIHNEIKALEEKLKERERQLAYYEGSEAREAKLSEELWQLQNAMEKCKLNLNAKDTVITAFQGDLKTKETMLENTKVLQEKSNEQLAEAIQLVAAFRLREASFCESLAAALADLIQQKSALKSLQKMVQDKDRLLKDECNKINMFLRSAGARLTKEIHKSDSRTAELVIENNTFQQEQEELRQQLMAKDMQINELKDTTASSSKLAEEKTQLEYEKQELLRTVNEIADRNNVLKLENDTFQQTVRKQVIELEQSHLLQQKVQQVAEQVVAKLKQELALCQTELSACSEKLERLEGAYEEHEKLHEEVERMASLHAMRSDEVSDALHQAQGDLEALKNEREMMITSHQNQIEQLRESFKRRVAEVDKWPEKMEVECQREREKHTQEMSLLEENLKESFASEKQIQKQKYDELVETYRRQMKDAENKLKISLRDKHYAELNAMQQQMAASKVRCQDAEDSLRHEVASLKKIIADLEEKLARVDTDGGEKVQQLTGQLHDLNMQLSQLKDENIQLETQHSTSVEEIAFLQETVRRECEERFELTDALSNVKQELLAFKRLPGGSIPPRNNSLPDVVGDERQLRSLSRRGSPLAVPPVGGSQSSGHTAVSSARSNNSSRSSHATRHEELVLFRKAKQTRMPAPERAAGTDRGEEKGLKGGSISESRRRIAHAVARRASDQAL